MRTLNHKDLKKLVHHAYDRQTPIFVHGGTGIGKSETIKSVAQEIAKREKLEFSEDKIEDGKFGFVDIRVSQLDPSDLRGLPHIEGNKTKWVTPSWLPQNPKSKGIIFFDEINLASPSIQNASMQLILDKKLGDYNLPKGFQIVSAGNRLGDNSNIYDIPSPLANRFIHVELNVPSVEDWSNWGMNNGIDSRIISFLNFRPSLLYKFNPDDEDKAFPTPRMWSFTSKLINDIPSSDLKDVELFASASVGEATAMEFVAFVKLERQIKIKDLLANPKSVRNIESVDIKFALIGALAEHLKQNKNKKTLETINRIVQHLEAEFGILQLRLLKAVDPKFFVKTIVSTKEWGSLSKQYGKYLL